MKYDLSKELDINRFDFRADQLKEAGALVDLTRTTKPKTENQNSYYHVLVNLYSIEVGNTMAESKVDLKRACPFMRYEKKGFMYLRKTSLLDTKEMSEFITWIRNYAGTNGIFLPSADDYHRDWTEIEREIARHKVYL